MRREYALEIGNGGFVVACLHVEESECVTRLEVLGILRQGALEAVHGLVDHTHGVECGGQADVCRSVVGIGLDRLFEIGAGLGRHVEVQMDLTQPGEGI